MAPPDSWSDPAAPPASPPPPSTHSPSVWPSTLVGVGLTALLGAALTAFSTNALGSYGFGAFVLVPFTCALLGAALHTWRHPDDSAVFVRVPGALAGIASVLMMLALLLAMQLEGVICLLMALPCILVPAFFGAVVGTVIGGLLATRHRLPVLLTVVVLCPTLQHYESRHPPLDQPRTVETSRLVRASPRQVWAVLARPVAYPARVGWFFRAGVAYPTRTAPGAPGPDGRPTALVVDYSHGRVALPLRAWEPGRRLSFSIPTPPAPVRELSPYPRVHAPHLHGYFRVDEGTLALTPGPDGTTLLTARTVYRHQIGPRAYWGWWTDTFFDQLHARVLAELAQRAEAAPGSPALVADAGQR